MFCHLADCHYKAKQYSDAVREYEFVMGRKSKIVSQDYYNWGKATYFNKEYAKSDSAFAKVISLQPDMPVGYLWQGRSRASLDPETTKGPMIYMFYIISPPGNILTS
jgi:tetratricopeptide (TPR) repeat protein